MRFRCFRGRLLLVVAALVTVGCSPALDWRDVRPDESLLLLFPCKPDRHTRQVVVEGQALSMTLASCSTQGQTFALAYLDAASADGIDPLMRALQRGLRENLAGASVPMPADGQPFVVKGSSPNPLAQRVSAAGRRSDGDPVRAEAGFFCRGLRIYQATVIGSTLDGEALDTFLTSLSLSS